MKKHNLFKVVLITICVAVLLSWLLPVTYYSTSLVEDTRDQIGVFDLINYVGISVQYFSHIAIYVLSVGGFYGLVYRIPAYRNLIDKVVNAFDGREWLFMAIVVVLFGAGSAIAGLSLPLLFFFPFIIAVLLAMGYDRITAALVTAGSVVVGLIGSVFNVNNTYGFDMVLNVNPGDHWKYKVLLLVICLVALFVYILLYSKNHKDKKNANALFIPKESKAKRDKVWPLAVVFDVLLVMFALAFMPWNTFGVTAFTELHDKLSGFAIGNFPILDKIFGLSVAFGSWNLTEATVVLIIATLLIAFVYRVKLNDLISCYMDGCERALKPACLVILMYVVLVATTYVPVLLTICKPILGEKFGLITASISTFIYSCFSVESYYVGTGLVPYVLSLAEATNANIMGISLMSQAFYGIAMLVAPTSVVLMATLAYLNIPYQKWLKSVWKLLLVLAVIALILIKIKM